MITIQVTENELNVIIKSLSKSANRKLKNIERWKNKKEKGLVIPTEVVDSFITIDNNMVNCTIRPLIERLECTKASFS